VARYGSKEVALIFWFLLRHVVLLVVAGSRCTSILSLMTVASLFPAVLERTSARVLTTIGRLSFLEAFHSRPFSFGRQCRRTKERNYEVLERCRQYLGFQEHVAYQETGTIGAL
jgi:hypothetical protein